MSSETFTGALAGTKLAATQTIGVLYGPIARGIVEIALGHPLMLSQIVTMGEKRENGTIDGGDYANAIKIATDIALGVALAGGATISVPIAAIWGIVGVGLFIYNNRENIDSIIDGLNDAQNQGPLVTGDPFTGLPWPEISEGKIDNQVNVDWRSATTWRAPRDPLAIDVDRDGIETVGIPTTSTPILFDHNADGIQTGTGWLQGDDAWLVLDRNANGTIDSGRELFGVDTEI